MFPKVLWCRLKCYEGHICPASVLCSASQELELWKLQFPESFASRVLFRFCQQGELVQDQKVVGREVGIPLPAMATARAPIMAVTTAVSGCRSQPVLVTAPPTPHGGKGIRGHRIWNAVERSGGFRTSCPSWPLPSLLSSPPYTAAVQTLLLNPSCLKYLAWLLILWPETCYLLRVRNKLT